MDRPNANPLFIDVILNEIWPKLELKDLLSSQLVCQKWCALTTPFVRKYGPRIEFKTSEILDQILPRIDRIRTGCALLDAGNELNVECGKLILHVNDDCREYRELMNICTPAVTHLEVLGTESILSKEKILRNWIFRNPELKTIKIDSEVLQKSGRKNEKKKQDGSVKLKSLKEVSLGKISNKVLLKPGFFNKLFRASQNLEHVWIDLIDYEEDDNDYNQPRIHPDPQIVAIQNVDVVLKSLEDHGNLNQLKSMKFTRMANSHLTSLLRFGGNGLNLKRFEIGTDNWSTYGYAMENFDEQKLNEFLYSQRMSLTKLTLPASKIQDLLNAYPGRVVPTLDVLESLELVVRKGVSFGPRRLAPGDRPPPPSFRFHEMFPNLTSLSLKGYGMSGLLDSFFADTHPIIPCTTLKHLRLPPGNFTAQSDFAEPFSQLFPNITSLDVRLPTNELLHGIWKFWPELTDLKAVCVSKPRATRKPKFGMQKPRFGLPTPRYGYKKPKLGNPDNIPIEPRFGFNIPAWDEVYFPPKPSNLWYSDYLDYGFTGIDRKMCSQVEENGWNSDIATSSFIEEFKIKPSIADLKKLKRLDLQFLSVLTPGITRQAKIVSDIFIYTTLMRMPQLEEVVITETLLNMGRVLDKPSSDLSLKAIEDLKKALIKTKIQVTSKNVGQNWEDPYKIVGPAHVYDIADFDEQPYRILRASSICEQPPKSLCQNFYNLKLSQKIIRQETYSLADLQGPFIIPAWIKIGLVRRI